MGDKNSINVETELAQVGKGIGGQAAIVIGVVAQAVDFKDGKDVFKLATFASGALSVDIAAGLCARLYEHLIESIMRVDASPVTLTPIDKSVLALTKLVEDGLCREFGPKCDN